MSVATEPRLQEFFIVDAGVCVYVNVGGYSIRVWFESSTDRGHVAESLPLAEEARAAAEAALRKHHVELRPLFEKVANKPA